MIVNQLQNIYNLYKLLFVLTVLITTFELKEVIKKTKTISTMTTLNSLIKSISNVEKLLTASKKVESADLSDDYRIDYDSVNIYGGRDTIVIIERETEKEVFRKTYEKGFTMFN